MRKTDDIPIWVYLAFSSIETRKGALLLIKASIIFSLYCIPWVQIVPNQDWMKNIFLIDDWSWFLMMVLFIFWYWISLRWIDNNSKWPDSVCEEV